MSLSQPDKPILDCATAQESLYALLEGALSPQEEKVVRGHITACASCGHEWNAIRSVEQALLSARESLPSAGDLSAGFYAKLAQEQKPFHQPRLWKRWSIAVPAMALGVLAIMLYHPQSDLSDLQVAHSTAPKPSPQLAQAPPKKSPIEITRQGSTMGVHSVTFMDRTKHKSMIASRSLSSQVSGMWDQRSPAVTGLLLGDYKRAPARDTENRFYYRQAGLQLASTNLPASDPTSSQIEIEVVDTERGFESKNRVESEETLKDGVRTVTIDESDTTPRVETLVFQESSE